MNAYETKTNRKKLIKAYGSKSPIVTAMYIREDLELVLTSSSGRMLLFNTAVISPKTTKDTQGVGVMTMKKGQRLMGVRPYVESFQSHIATEQRTFRLSDLCRFRRTQRESSFRFNL